MVDWRLNYICESYLMTIPNDYPHGTRSARGSSSRCRTAKIETRTQMRKERPMEQRHLTDNETLRLRRWAGQTVTLAISVRAKDDGWPLEEKSQADHAKSAGDHVASELWDEAQGEFQMAPAVINTFARKVLLWCSDHLRNDNGL
jgi:hypothetical protein